MAASILAVDDERFFCRMISATLTGAGYRVVTLQNSQEALAMLDQERPDLLILDVMMPGISGLDLAQQVRAQEQTHALPLVIMTALDDSGDSLLHQRLQTLGAYHVPKPFSRKQLLDVVQTALGNTAN